MRNSYAKAVRLDATGVILSLSGELTYHAMRFRGVERLQALSIDKKMKLMHGRDVIVNCRLGLVKARCERAQYLLLRDTLALSVP